jgi:hypothetical protein
LKDKTVEEQAYDITRTIITKMRRDGQLPPAHIFNDDDFEDTVGDVYTYQILPMLGRFDPEQAKLMTFIYAAIVRWAPRTAWKLKKCGINTRQPIEIIHYAEVDETDKGPADGAEEGGGEHTIGLQAIERDSLPPYADVVTYRNPPEGYEVPGSEAWEDTQLRGARVAHMRKLIEALPKEQRRAIQKRVLIDKPVRGRMPARATICEIARGLEARFSRRDLETLNNRGCNNTTKSASEMDASADPQGSAADSDDGVVLKTGSIYGRR